jgi:hypothetical protein
VERISQLLGGVDLEQREVRTALGQERSSASGSRSATDGVPNHAWTRQVRRPHLIQHVEHCPFGEAARQRYSNLCSAGPDKSEHTPRQSGQAAGEGTARNVSWLHSATSLWTLGLMSILYLREVPAEVIERLTRLAERKHASVSAVAVRELAEATRRADDPVRLAALPDTDIPVDAVIDALDAGRADR